MSQAATQGDDRGQNLSENQVESLIKAMESVARDSHRAGAEPHVASRPHSPEIDADLLAAVVSFHQSIAGELSETLSATLRTAVEVRVAEVNPVFFDSFRVPPSDHHWWSVLSPAAGVGDWHLQITPEICQVMVDRMLGGDPTEGDISARAMTEIECRLMARLVDAAVETLGRMWQKVAEVYWMVSHGEATAASTAQPEPMVQIHFAVALGCHQGSIRLSIPIGTIENFRAQLCDRSWQLDSASVVGSRQQLTRNVASAPIDVIANLARSTIRTGDLLDLDVGDVIATEKHVDEPLELTIQNVPKFKIRAGAMKGQKAFQIEAMLEPPDPGDVQADTAVVKDLR